MQETRDKMQDIAAQRGGEYSKTMSNLIIVTGYSGAGKNTVLRALEDSGFFCIDNLPSALLDSLFRLVVHAKLPGQQRIALGLDVRGDRNIQRFISELYKIRDTWKLSMQLVFVTSSPEVLFKRFQETRRNHPLADTIDLAQAIAHERDLLKPLLDIADIVLDTDQLTIQQLRNFISTSFQIHTDKKMTVSLTSFGFKYGVPSESNLVLDVRFLPNPYFIPALKPLTGTDQQVLDYLFGQSLVQEYWQRFIDFVTYSIERSCEEGRFFITVAIGCTGGRHRSVALVHMFSQQQLAGIQFIVKHRDIHRDQYD